MQNRGGDRPRGSRPRSRRCASSCAASGRSWPSRRDGQVAARQDRAPDRRPDGGRGVLDLSATRQDGVARAVRHRGPQPGGGAHHLACGAARAWSGAAPSWPCRSTEPDAQNHPAFSYRPETGEEIYHSLPRRADPARRATCSACWSCRTRRRASTPTTRSRRCRPSPWCWPRCSLSGELSPAPTPRRSSNRAARPRAARRAAVAEGIGAGPCRAARAARRRHRALINDDPEAETRRLDAALEDAASVRSTRCWSRRDLAGGGRAPRRARGLPHVRPRPRLGAAAWRRRSSSGLTAEAAVERVQNDTRARMLRQADPYLRERLRDLDDLSDRLLRHSAGAARRPRATRAADRTPSWSPAPWARPTARLRPRAAARAGAGGGSADQPCRHRRPGAGHRRRSARRAAPSRMVDEGDPIIVDGETARCHLRPASEVVERPMRDKVRFRPRRQQQYRRAARHSRP